MTSSASWCAKQELCLVCQRLELKFPFFLYHGTGTILDSNELPPYMSWDGWSQVLVIVSSTIYAVIASASDYIYSIISQCPPFPCNKPLRTKHPTHDFHHLPICYPQEPNLYMSLYFAQWTSNHYVRRLKIFIYINPILCQIVKHHAAQKKAQLTHFSW